MTIAADILRRSEDSVDDDAVAATDDAGAGSYVCSMSSSDIDLTRRADLAASVADYLARLVDELHLISHWTADCCRYMLVSQEERRRAARAPPPAAPVPTAVDDAMLSPRLMALVQTELALLRQELQRARLEQTQRCASSVAHVESAVRAKHTEQLGELQRRIDDQLRGFTEQTIGAATRHERDNDARITTVEASLRQLQTQLADSHATLGALEAATTRAVATLTGALSTQQRDVAACARRVENAESSLSLQLSDVRDRIDAALQGLRAGQSQLAAKLHVVRTEVHESAAEGQRKVQQLTKLLQTRGGGLHQDMTRMPSVAPSAGAPRTPPLTPRAKQDDPSCLASSGAALAPNGVKVPTGAAAVLATPDCFVYAKASLPPRDAAESTTSRTTQSRLSTSRGLERRPSSPPSRASSGIRARDLSDPTLDDVLVIHQSVLSQPLGRDDGDDSVVDSMVISDNSEHEEMATQRDTWASSPVASGRESASHTGHPLDAIAWFIVSAEARALTPVTADVVRWQLQYEPP
ncbi:hypothetical protein PybrP1_000918 [[Pythium] brassicae (nom. inval.)]|nr:hypothetical protein PybrP1_000918 [[Pythium] brassicae (nom. inval.)]